MKEKLSLSLAKQFKRLLDGQRLSSKSLPSQIAGELSAEELLAQASRGSQRSYQLIDAPSFRFYLAQRYDLKVDLEEWIEIKSREKEVKRSEQVRILGDSKARKTRTFKGFLVKSYLPIEATLRGVELLISPLKGISTFVEDYESFRIPNDVVVIGIENGENFRYIDQQEYLFEGLKVLFVSRYPQSKDLLAWLETISNRYIHFGDFDLAGIHIFLTEYYARLAKRAEFFIPSDLEERLKEGSRILYDNQYFRFKAMEVIDERLQPLVRMIHQYRRCYEQEGYIND